MIKSYKSTIVSCYISNIATSFATGTQPLLYIAIMAMYQLSFEQIGRLILIGFSVQMASDIAFARVVDKYGVRPFIVLGHFLAFLGLVLYGFAPRMWPQNPYAGFVTAVVVQSIGGGLHELLLSPIISAIPMSESKKSGTMTMLHSFYAWGNVAAVIATTLMLRLLGNERWPIIIWMWSALPVVGLILFTKVPLAPMVSEAHRTKTRDLLKNRTFLVVLLAIVMGGAAEVSMSQWISGYCDAALKLPKLFGDLVGACMFSVMLGLGRSLYGKISGKLSIERAMLIGSAATCICFVISALSPIPLLSLVLCALSGLGVSLLWPGSVVLAAKTFPLAGASMFALMSAGGDMGGAFGPWLVGLVAHLSPERLSPLLPALAPESLGLRAGMLLAALFPIGMILCLRALRKGKAQNNTQP